MKKHIVAAAAAALALGSVSLASAASVPCPVTYAHPSKAKQTKASFVQAFISCNNPGGNTANATTETGSTPTCFPAETGAQKTNSEGSGAWLWGPKSQGSITFKSGKNKITEPQPPNVNDPTAVDLSIQVKFSDIHDNTGLADNVNGRVQALSRATLIDRKHNQLMTVVDFPTGFSIHASGGKISKKTSATVILNGLNQPALPACTTVEMLAVLVKDPVNNVFANLGNYLP